MKKNWTDIVIHELDAAWGEADKIQQGQPERDKAVTAAAQKHFRPGMTREDIRPLLNAMKNHDYAISEYRHDGIVSQSTGQLMPYGDEATRRSRQAQIAKGISQFHITKGYGQIQFAILKFVGISFAISDSDDRIFDVKANLSQSAM
jgi:hypothetical protein